MPQRSCKHCRAFLRPLLVKELVNGLVGRRERDVGRHDLVKRLAKMRRSSLGRSGLDLPDCSTSGSTPAKPTIELRRGNLRTSPISAISWAAVISPTPYMARTASYSGSCRARRFISCLRLASSSFAEVSSLAAVWISTFVTSAFGSVVSCLRL